MNDHHRIEDLESVLAAEQAKNSRLVKMLKQLQWSDTSFVFSVSHGKEILVHRCPVCNYSKEYYNWKHSEHCALGNLLKEME